ncbi:uncharacterized protein MYCFIDRAFT_199064 [Pseudocercospora fijiensis CIRAD86]|uniref:Uncharacterized protein n=1 Tax=Pseudocercospora fijiensis (strain CIRAD86) TaxID=383855 RepID=M3A3Q5_PSEFD|nr:uncharacterized protein MYCFIDRAFT_199064 [Pseudocercospora fijiensis CIRAD86]EME79241.1 hypothetical protein MYCFIDRAFT_199064 [Pseudocercospora fijiensis CIRAD86]
MGAWGYGLFQSDHDYDEISGLDAEAGFHFMQEEAEAKGEKNVNIGLFDPSDPDFIRKYIEASGTLDEMIAKYTAAAAAAKTDKWDRGQRDYRLCLMGACFMMLGCKLSDDFLDLLRDKFTNCGFMPDALKQLDAALNRPDGFKSDTSALTRTIKARVEANRMRKSIDKCGSCGSSAGKLETCGGCKHRKYVLSTCSP